METFEGGCHCRAVRFRVHVATLRALECNCSICSKKGFLHVIVPHGDFQLLRGADAIATYTFHTHTAKHHFCRHCGVSPHYIPRSHPDGVSTNLRCFDGDAIRRFTIVPFDGRDWEANVHEIR